MDIATLRDTIDTIVIVMMENRSFDHLLGYLSHEDYDSRSDVNGLHRPGPDFDWANPGLDGTSYAPEHDDSLLITDLPHSRSQVTMQLNDGAMDGFVRAYFTSQNVDRGTPPAPMRFCAPSDVPVTAALADGYCVCDNWFASIPNDTQPNRAMAVSGASILDSTGDLHPGTAWLPDQPTILNWLRNKNIPYEIFVDAPYIVGTGRPSNFILMSSQWPLVDGLAFGIDELQSRWGAGATAPSVIYCEPYYNDLARVFGGHGTCNHPPLPLGYGEEFIKKVYRALTSNPARWKRTVMVLCYDEHGGFFDHVAPPPMRSTMPQGGRWHDKSPYTTLGMRVPGIIVSPHVDERSVYSGLLDHTSILQFVVDRFGDPADLAFFGEAEARRTDANSPVQSITDVLSLDVPRIEIPPVPTPSIALQPAGAGASGNTHLFVNALRAKAHAAGVHTFDVPLVSKLTVAKPVPKKPAVKKPAAKKPAPKKPVAKKPAPKKPVAKPAAKKSAARRPMARKRVRSRGK